jgi:hypothetical protein
VFSAGAAVAALADQQGSGATPARYQLDPDLRVPYMIQTAVGVERQFPRGMSLAVNYTGTRGVHELLTRDINAPLPVLFNSFGEAIGPRPFGAGRATSISTKAAAYSGRISSSFPSTRKSAVS